MGLSYPPFKTWFLIYPGLVILLYLVLDSARLRQAFGRGYLTLLVFNIVAVYWIGGWTRDDIFLKIAGATTVLAHPVFMLIPVLITYGIYKQFRKEVALIFFPLIWLGFEYLHNTWQLCFPWLDLGNSETYNLNRIQYIELIGVHGTSFLICIVSSLLYYFTIRISSGQWKIRSTKPIAIICIILIIIIAPYFYSYYRLRAPENINYFQTTDSSKIVSTTIIQPNMDPFKKWTGNVDTVVNIDINWMEKALSRRSDFLVLHETAVPYDFFGQYYFYDTRKFLNFIDDNKKYLMIGIPYFHYYSDTEFAPSDSKYSTLSKRKYDEFNSAILLEPGKSINDFTIHEKVKLVPFSERPPYLEYLPFLGKWIRWGVGISEWQIGPGMTVFNMDNPCSKVRAKFETLICFESVFSDFVREGVKDGAEFLVIITNDGWFGKSSGPIQHEQYAVLRAIENRKWIIRSAQTGISSFIDPLGNQYQQTGMYTEAMITQNIVANSEKTFYSETGDLIGRIGFYVGALCLFVEIILYVYRRKKSKLA